MNQIKIGNFISAKRKEKNLTQEQLAAKLGVSNKTVSKWECGRCMPDYSIIEDLCNQLDINISELVNGCECGHHGDVNNTGIIQLMGEIELIKLHNIEVTGILLFILSVVVYCLSLHCSFPFEITVLYIFIAVSIVGGAFAFVWSHIRKRKIKNRFK